MKQWNSPIPLEKSIKMETGNNHYNEFEFGESVCSKSLSIEGIIKGLGRGGDLIRAIVL